MKKATQKDLYITHINIITEDDKENMNPYMYKQNRRRQSELSSPVLKDITEETLFRTGLKSLLICN